MKAWELLDSSSIPGSAGTLRLMRRGFELAIHVDGRELMRNTVHGSEDALAELSCARIASAPLARVLVGGLGMGFTLAAALSNVGPGAQVVVAELVPSVVRWNRGVLSDVAGRPLDDPRSSVYEGDVADLIRRPPSPWDAILLDVDNGPTALTSGSNDQLYSAAGLAQTFDALRPAGVLSVWSAVPEDRAFTRRMKRAGFAVEVHEVRSRGRDGGRRHVIWIGVRQAEAPRWHRAA
jgi:spermidine synthase